MMPDRQGFTLVELLVVLTVASILLLAAFPRIQGAFHDRDVKGARDGVLLLAAQARARAMEKGRTVEFHFDQAAGVASLIQAGDTVDAFRFGELYGVEAASSKTAFRMCYTARGFATEPCSTSLGGPLQITFGRAGHTAALQVWQLGQLRKL